MKSVFAIDPGKCTGWAWFRSGELLAAGVLDGGSTSALVFALGELEVGVLDRPFDLVVEIPQVYPREKWKGDPNDLVQVAYMAGVVAGTVASTMSFDREDVPVQLVKPHQWKGSRPKKVCHESIMQRLSVEERAVVEDLHLSASRRHNMLDAVGLGLWHLQRSR